jgi:hypothetical protein
MFGMMTAATKPDATKPAETSDSGREVIRQLLRGWAASNGGLAHLARTLSPPVGIEAMSAFARGASPTLAAEALDTIARSLLRARYHPAPIDKLEQLVKPAVTSLPAARPFVPQNELQRRIHDFMNMLRAEREAEAAAARPKHAPGKFEPQPRPGWIF